MNLYEWRGLYSMLESRMERLPSSIVGHLPFRDGKVLTFGFLSYSPYQVEIFLAG